MKKSYFLLILVFFAVAGVFFYRGFKSDLFSNLIIIDNNSDNSNSTTTISSSVSSNRVSDSKKIFIENFGKEYILEESSIEESNDPNWSVSAGGYLIFKNGIGETVQGNLPDNDKWRISYNQDNPIDSDNGYHPQNIFRLVMKDKWLNYEQTAYFRITKDNLSDSPNRRASNGLLFFNRYKDADNLYYTGIRVDGLATIKKKIEGNYYTIIEKKVFDGIYDIDENPTLLPKNIWVGLKSVIKNNPDGSIDIKLFIDKNETGEWELLIESKDDGEIYGGKAFLTAGHTGIRTDFMDVEFKNYEVKEF